MPQNISIPWSQRPDSSCLDNWEGKSGKVIVNSLDGWYSSKLSTDGFVANKPENAKKCCYYYT